MLDANRKRFKARLLALVALAFALVNAGALAADAAASAPASVPAIAAASAPATFSPKGADTCLRCHDDPAVTVIFKTKHAVAADERTPFAHLQCESCHGPGGDHAGRQRPGEPRPPIPLFGEDWKDKIAKENTTCLSCHQDRHRVGWQGSVHDRENVACVSCHRIHAARDPVTQVSEQPKVCYQCHQDVRADLEKFSAHPVRDGNLDCTSCHAPHDSLFPALLKQPTVNQTCESCHAQMRGPFLWEHPPVAEDCGNCHVPHGSVNPSLLTSRPPLLCQQCHAPNDHPSIPFTGAVRPGGAPSAFLLGSSCVNCHSRVHGSNAPSGADLSR